MFATATVTAQAARTVLLGALACLPIPCQAQPASPPVLADTAAIRDGELAAAVERAMGGASRLLGRPACAQVLDDFTDDHATPLRDVLTSLNLSPHGALSRMIVRDGRDHATCRRGHVSAFTGPGSRVVFVCGNRFGGIDGARAQRVMIHELLHTLGLNERPPTPGEIDGAVARRCAA